MSSAMYNKLFTKILDSSIWLASPENRIVWITFLAAMDEDGFVAMATVANVARRANVDEIDAAAAIDYLEAPDPSTPECPFEGRRIERVPGGWIVLKAQEYADIVRRVEMKALNRERVRRYRERHANVTASNESVTDANDRVMQSDTDTDIDTDVRTPPPPPRGGVARTKTKALVKKIDEGFEVFWRVYPKKVGKGEARKAWTKARPSGDIVGAVERQKRSKQWLRDGGRFIPNPATWLNQERWNDEPDPDVPQLSDRTIANLSAGEAFLRGDYDRER